MEPKLPTPNSSPEKAPITPGNTSFEHGVRTSPEAPLNPDYRESGIEQAREQLSGIGVGDTAAPQVTARPVAPPQPVAQQQAMAADDTPLVAADDDLIEKAWVDKAKKIVVATRDDPYAQEREVSKLQADYLQKRYGKEIKLSNQ
jgi:hypothetical protein